MLNVSAASVFVITDLHKKHRSRDSLDDGLQSDMVEVKLCCFTLTEP